jgi:uncharacterized protein YbcI
MGVHGQHADAGQALLSRISNEMVRAQKQFFGKGPEQAKTYLLDDMCIIVMRGGLTRAEETMLEFGHPDQVRGFRQLFENEMTERLVGMIEELTDRKVINYQSQVMFDPDVIVEMFIFDDRVHHDGMAATAHGLVSGDDTGEASGDAELEGAAGSGQGSEGDSPG